MVNLDVKHLKYAQSSLVKIILFILLGITTSIVSIISADHFADRETTYILIILMILCVFGPIIMRFRKKSFDLAEPGVWFSLYYFTLFGLRAIYDLEYGSQILGLDPGISNLELINKPLVVAIASIMLFWIGYHLKLGRVVSNSVPKLPRSWNRTHAIYAAFFCLVLGWASRYILIIYSTGSLEAWLNADKYILLTQSSGIQYLSILGRLATVGLFIIFFLFRSIEKRSFLLVFTLVLIPEVAYNLLGGSRAQFVFLLLSLLIGFYLCSERRFRDSMQYFKWAAVIGLIFIVLYPVLSLLRVRGLNDVGTILSDVTGLWINPNLIFEQIGARQHGLDSLGLIMNRVPEVESFTFGSELLLLFVAWIPRSLWQDKPVVSVGKVFYEKFWPPIFHEGSSAALTLPGEFYWDLGIIGIIIGMIFIGIIWRFMHEYLVRQRNNISNALVVSVMFQSFFIPAEQTLVDLITVHLLMFFLIFFITALIKGNDVSMNGG